MDCQGSRLLGFSGGCVGRFQGLRGGGVEFRVWEGRVPVERTVDVLKVQVQS